ncbi:MAG: hypothetical protein BroJett042_14080 [Bacteroidota bacterium]|nr:MAG: hypothetical protein BroJett042_14080 [Bacteroidota bacterium]
MRLLLLLLVATTISYAQDLPTSRRSSYYTFVYKVTNAEAEALYKNRQPTQAFCHSLFTLYPSDSARFQDKLPVGHYLEVKTIEGKLHYELVSINNTNLTLLSNQRDFIFTISDQSGNRINNAQVKIRNQPIAFNNKDNAYVDQKSNKRGLLSVTVNGHTAYFQIERQRNNTLFVRSGKRILGTFPINHIASVIVYPVRTVKNLVKGYGVSAPGIYYKAKQWIEPKYEKDWKGYIVFNKPIFKPGDTLRIKAFFTNKRGKPISKTLDLRLYAYGHNPVNVKLGHINPYRTGGFVHEVVLTDSLNLSLDTNPTISFEHRNKIVESKSFRYEQYELKANQFLARSENNRKEKGGILYLKGTDSNDMPLYDVQAEVLVMPKHVNTIYQTQVFVPDTLWFHKIKLDVVGETKIVLPDSIFPKADLTYKAVVAFLNADNERQTKELILQYNFNKPPVRFEIKNDSIWVTAGALTDSAELTALGWDDEEIFTKQIQLPYHEKINPFIKEYEAGMSTSWEFLEMAEYDKLEVLSTRTKDSISITISNPRKIPVHYQIFKNRNQIDRGSTDESATIFTGKSQTRELFTISIQYVWAGVSKNENYTVDFNDRQLNISIAHAPLVYPGQTSEFTVNVSDVNGNPVNDADVTALAYTKKFKQGGVAQVPTYPRKQNGRLFFNAFSKGEFETLNVTKLDWLLWHKTLGLDSISFYQFLYPANGQYEFSKPNTDSITQIAPFLIENGLVLMPHVIYIDNTPVFHLSANTIQPYSFRIDSGNHRVQIRVRNYAISFSVEVKKNHKQIISLDLNHLPTNVLKTELTKEDLAREANTLSKYFITVERSEKQALAYIMQNNNYFLFNPSPGRGYPQPEIVGPLHPQLTQFFSADTTALTFNFEPFYSYRFLPGLIRQRSITAPILKSQNYRLNFSPSFDDRVLTKSEIEKRWSDFSAIKNPRFARYPIEHFINKPAGALSLALIPSSKPKTHLATFLINLDSPDQYSIYPASNLEFAQLGAAHYEVVLLMNDGQYLRSGSFFLKPFGQTLIKFNFDSLQIQDTFSEKLYNTLKKWDAKTTYIEQQRRIEMNEVRTSYYQRNQSYPYHGTLVRGRVYSSEDGMPLPGVNVIVKGTIYGTVTDTNGEYYLTVPAGGTLVFSFIGLKTEEINTNNRNEVDVELTADVTQLSEVVVVGFAAQRKMSLSGSVTVQSNLLHGRLAGIQVSGNPGNNQHIYLRGVSTLDSGHTPIIVLDGIIIDAQTYRNMDPNAITAIEVLDNKAAVALYGSRASGGVIILSSKQKTTLNQLLAMPLPGTPMASMPEGVLPGNSIRKNFRDYAFWQPRLTTNKDGKAKFIATFPDDITGWKIEALVMASKKRSGLASSQVQSYKPLLAQVATPHFLVEGDNTNAIGKITNYTTDTLSIIRTIEVEGNLTNIDLQITNSHVDSLILFASSPDSIHLKYAIKQKEYEDGESRTIPVFKRGVKDADGLFVALPNDTIITIALKPGSLRIYAQSDILDVVLNEIESVKNYPYDCNEQLASKLQVLLAEKKIAEFRKEKFKQEDRVKRIIKKLSENQHKDGGWGWWNQSEGLMWITLHVVHGLELAEKEGFKTIYNKEGVLTFLQSGLLQLPLREQILPMQFLVTHNIKVNVQPLYDSLIKTDLSVYSRLRLAELMQHANLPYDKTWLSDFRNETVKGNYYWGTDALHLFDNAIMSTLIAYRLLKNEKASNTELQRIRNFFLEARTHSWRNTFESASIIETLLPDLISLTANYTKTELTLMNKTITKFPYDTIVQVNGSLTVQKIGIAPVYLTAYREFWNASPKRIDKDFVVSSYFQDSTTQLIAGKPVSLTVKLIVKKDTEYLLLNIPIPAGCSYENKNQNRTNGEVHRQYDYHQTTIFCKSLKAGEYFYTIPLVPRFTGKYTLNPARAEWMYFPTVYGQETPKQIHIK